MLLNGKTKDQVVDIATRPRFAGLMARNFGRAWCESNLAKATHAAIVAKVTSRAGSKTTLAAQRLIAASKAADRKRLQAVGAK